jgi:putative transposase
MESFWGTMQLELLDTKEWETRDELANALFEWIKCWYDPKRRHTSIGMRSPVTFEILRTGPDQDHLPIEGVSCRFGGRKFLERTVTILPG